jgi:hypothetical protein
MASRKQVNVVVDAETHERMIDYAASHGGMSMGAVIRLALRFLLPPISSNDVPQGEEDAQEGTSTREAPVEGDPGREGQAE